MHEDKKENRESYGYRGKRNIWTYLSYSHMYKIIAEEYKKVKLKWLANVSFQVFQRMLPSGHTQKNNYWRYNSKLFKETNLFHCIR